MIKVNVETSLFPRAAAQQQPSDGRARLRGSPAGRLMDLWDGYAGEMSEAEAICPPWTSVSTLSFTCGGQELRGGPGTARVRVHVHVCVRMCRRCLTSIQQRGFPALVPHTIMVSFTFWMTVMKLSHSS